MDAGVAVLEQCLGTIEKCVISGNAFSGVEIKTGGNPVIRDCKVSGRWGVTVRPDGLGTISGCDLTGATTPWGVEGGAKVTRTGNRPNA
jgi:F-box protein 11